MPSQARWKATLLLAAAAFVAACSDRGSPGSSADAVKADTEPTLELLFAYGSEKQNWIDESTAAFNGERHRLASGKLIRVRPQPMGSGEIIDDILAGRAKPHVISPASAAFIKLGNADSRARTGQDLVGPTQNLVLSPVVIAMWKPMAEALGWGKKAIGWSDVVAIARRPDGWASMGHPEWGPFRLGHTHPRASNSGLISLLAEAYAGAGKVSHLTLEDLRKDATGQFVEGVEQAVVHYGSSTGFFGRAMFSNGPTYLSAAVLYENMVIESYDPKYALPFPIVAVYPKEGTFWSDHPAGIVERDWVTPEHREAAQQYLGFLLARKQQERAITFGFRPADPAVPIGAPIDAAHGVNPREPQTTLEVPEPTVVNAVLDLWQRTKRNARVVLAVDVSGSMNDAGKIVAARDGAAAFLSALGDRDEIAVMTFNDQVRWLLPRAPIRDARDKAQGMVKGLFADGGTSLYDAIARAYDSFAADPTPSRITAIVVLSDGADRNSAMTLQALLDKVRFTGERSTVRIFTIGYGADALADPLQAIADATKGRYFAGKPESIRDVFKEISTFF